MGIIALSYLKEFETNCNFDSGRPTLLELAKTRYMLYTTWMLYDDTPSLISLISKSEAIPITGGSVAVTSS